MCHSPFQINLDDLGSINEKNHRKVTDRIMQIKVCIG